MGLFSGISSMVSTAISGVCGVVGSICSSIAGALGGTALGGAISSFITRIGVVIPGLDIISAIFMIVDIICKIAEALGIKDKDRDEPDELALKAEKDDKKPEDFDTVESYVKHLQQDIKLTKEERERLNTMSDEERAAYKATGAYLYAKCCNEKLGFDTEGLKNPELVGITVDILADIAKLKDILMPTEFVACCKYLRNNNMGVKELANYFHNKSGDLTTDEKVQNAIIDAMKEITPEITEEEINKKLYNMNIGEN